MTVCRDRRSTNNLVNNKYSNAIDTYSSVHFLTDVRGTYAGIVSQ